MADNQTSYSGGISTLGLLGVVFVTLKLLGLLTWSWWWVTAPFWGPFALFLTIMFFVVLVGITVAVFKHLLDK